MAEPLSILRSNSDEAPDGLLIAATTTSVSSKSLTGKRYHIAGDVISKNAPLLRQLKDQGFYAVGAGMDGDFDFVGEGESVALGHGLSVDCG